MPTEPLIQRALQGGTKHASGATIISTVSELASELRRTQAVIGKVPTPELSAGATALHAGATADELRVLKATQPHRVLTVAFATLADLVSHGVAAPRASETIRTALIKGATDSDLLALRRNVEKDIHAGAQPSAAAGLRAKGIQPRKQGKTETAIPRKK